MLSVETIFTKTWHYEEDNSELHIHLYELEIFFSRSGGSRSCADRDEQSPTIYDVMDNSGIHQVIYLRYAYIFVVFLLDIKLRPKIYIYTHTGNDKASVQSRAHVNILYTNRVGYKCIS